MSLQLPADIDSVVQSFIAGGQYKDEAAVLREALAILQRRHEDLAAIQEGLDDEAAGRVIPAREALEQAGQRLRRGRQ